MSMSPCSGPTARNCPGCRRATTPERARCSTTPRCPSCRCARRCWRPRRTCRNHQRRLHQRLRQRRRDQLHLRRQGGDPHHRAGRRVTRRALDHRAGSARPTAPLQGGDLPEDGLPADHRGKPVGHGRQPAVPEVPRLERAGDARSCSPTTPTSCSPRPPGRGTSSPATSCRAPISGSGKRSRDNNIPILAMRDTPWLVRNGQPFFPADCLADGGDAISCGIKRSDVLSDHNPTLDFVARFPLLKPLDMSDAVCRKDFCRAVEGNVLMYHDSHHLSTTYMRTMTNELGRQIGAATGWW